ncbi:MAG: hypothetical protein HZA07_00540 [Nitrospirae bacterium]|nr:hypothetical protein [Nitrospirota bacterium]
MRLLTSIRSLHPDWDEKIDTTRGCKKDFSWSNRLGWTEDLIRREETERESELSTSSWLAMGKAGKW